MLLAVTRNSKTDSVDMRRLAFQSTCQRAAAQKYKQRSRCEQACRHNRVFNYMQHLHEFSRGMPDDQLLKNLIAIALGQSASSA
jgi:hypothetical protein